MQNKTGKKSITTDNIISLADVLKDKNIPNTISDEAVQDAVSELNERIADDPDFDTNGKSCPGMIIPRKAIRNKRAMNNTISLARITGQQLRYDFCETRQEKASDALKLLISNFTAVQTKAYGEEQTEKLVRDRIGMYKDMLSQDVLPDPETLLHCIADMLDNAPDESADEEPISLTAFRNSKFYDYMDKIDDFDISDITAVTIKHEPKHCDDMLSCTMDMQIIHRMYSGQLEYTDYADADEEAADEITDMLTDIYFQYMYQDDLHAAGGPLDTETGPVFTADELTEHTADIVTAIMPDMDMNKMLNEMDAVYEFIADIEDTAGDMEEAAMEYNIDITSADIPTGFRIDLKRALGQVKARLNRFDLGQLLTGDEFLSIMDMSGKENNTPDSAALVLLKLNTLLRTAVEDATIPKNPSGMFINMWLTLNLCSALCDIMHVGQGKKNNRNQGGTYENK